jgi:hypothetical protein
MTQTISNMKTGLSDQTWPVVLHQARQTVGPSSGTANVHQARQTVFAVPDEGPSLVRKFAQYISLYIYMTCFHIAYINDGYN